MHDKGLTVELWKGYVKNNHKKMRIFPHTFDSIAKELKHDLSAVLDCLYLTAPFGVMDGPPWWSLYFVARPSVAYNTVYRAYLFLRTDSKLDNVFIVPLMDDRIGSPSTICSL